MATAHINIGSNLGDRAAIIRHAVAAVEKALGSSARIASPVESEAWGYESPNRFLNVGIAVETALDPVEIMHRLASVEKSIDSSSHRTASGGYADRALDIDLIAVGAQTVASEDLTLPHPRMHLREFVLLPVAELEPQWRHPVLGMTACELLRLLQSDSSAMASMASPSRQ